MGWPQIIFGWSLVVGLLALAIGYGRSQLRSLHQSVGLPDEERRRLRGQSWRRLSASISMFLLALMLAGALIFLEEPLQHLAELRDGQIDKEAFVWSAEQWALIRFYSIYWIVFLLILMSVISLAAYEIWTVRRQVLREHRKLQADRRAMVGAERSGCARAQRRWLSRSPSAYTKSTGRCRSRFKRPVLLGGIPDATCPLFCRWRRAFTSHQPRRAEDNAPDFDRVIAPLLSRRCLDCHTGAGAKGKLDLSKRRTALAMGASAVIVPGKVEESPVWQRIRDDEMPPKKPLSPEEKGLLKAWIESGAKWGSDPIDPFRHTTPLRAGYDWWSLKPLNRPKVPTVPCPIGLRNAVDAFVLQRLKLAPSPEADRRTLIRRLTFDLTGLPPSPEEIEAFLTDKSPNAYEAVVDRLLASPHYGERSARHWLDLVRFGESDGFERDLPRSNAWPYRDWVVSALNADMPYDEFARLQLAGDVLAPHDSSALAATGFLVAGAHDIVLPVSGLMIETMRQDELEDIIGNVSQTFLGLTVHCAALPRPQVRPDRAEGLLSFRRHIGGCQTWRAILCVGQGAANARRAACPGARRLQTDPSNRGTARQAVLIMHKDDARDKRPAPLAEWSFGTVAKDRKEPLPLTLVKGAAMDRGLVLDGKQGYAFTEPLNVDLREKTIEASVRLANLDQRGGGVIGIQSLDGSIFDAVVFGEQEAGHWIAGSDGFRRTKSFGGPRETEAADHIVHFAITYAADGTITGYRNGQPYGQHYKSDGPTTFKAGAARVMFGIRHEPVGGNKMLVGTIESAVSTIGHCPRRKSPSPPEVAS